jgi:hypothetical protein
VDPEANVKRHREITYLTGRFLGEHITRVCHQFDGDLIAATGVPGETVRRKVRMLEEKGWLKLGERGELLVAPRIGKRFAAFDQKTNAEFERYARAVLKIIDAPRERRPGNGRGK